MTKIIVVVVVVFIRAYFVHDQNEITVEIIIMIREKREIEHNENMCYVGDYRHNKVYIIIRWLSPDQIH